MFKKSLWYIFFQGLLFIIKNFTSSTSPWSRSAATSAWLSLHPMAPSLSFWHQGAMIMGPALPNSPPGHWPPSTSGARKWLLEPPSPGFWRWTTMEPIQSHWTAGASSSMGQQLKSCEMEYLCFQFIPKISPLTHQIQIKYTAQMKGSIEYNESQISLSRYKRKRGSIVLVLIAPSNAFSIHQKQP